MASEPDLFGPTDDNSELKERYARSLDLSARTARALAESRAGSDVERLRKELQELRLLCEWQKKRIEHLETPLLKRGIRRILGDSETR